jgi:hypothetical protein
VPSPIRIDLDQIPSEDWDSVYVSFDVVAVDTIIDDTSPDLYLAVVEKNHRYPYPVGRWDYSLRDMVPNGNGVAITIQKGDSLHFEWAYRCTTLYNQDAILTTIWVQNDTDESVIDPLARGKVLQAASARVMDVSSVAGGETPARVYLGQNAPNPFTSETRIGYGLNRAGPVRLSVYDPAGRLVAHLVEGNHEPGLYSAAWNGRDRFGQDVGSGVYYYKLETECISRTGRMVRLK